MQIHSDKFPQRLFVLCIAQASRCYNLPVICGVRHIKNMNSKIIFSVIVTALIVSSLSAKAAESHKLIPKIFQGKWTSDIKNCEFDDETNLQIFKDNVSFYESSGPAISIVTKQEYELALIVELSGEGEEWLQFVHYKINAKNNQLTDITDAYEKNKLVRYRCKQ